jgi:hypothetical protein
MDWVAITGIVVSGLLGPGLAAIWATRSQRIRFTQERVLRDTAELRIVIDEVAQVLERADVTIRLAIIADSDVEADKEEVGRRLTSDIHAVSMLIERVAMRLGSKHDVTRCLRNALGELCWAFQWQSESRSSPGSTRRRHLLECQDRYREFRTLVLAFALPLVASHITPLGD